jgi:hypothetical protein
MIYFLHNTFNRPKQVVQHSKIEKFYFNDSKHIIVYNNKLQFEPIDNTEFYYFGENKGHKAGCLNAVYSALKKVVFFNDLKDDDVIFFSHDDIYMSNKMRFTNHLEMMKQYDFISRRCIKNKHVPDNCQYYVMMESFFIKPKGAWDLVRNYTYNEFSDSDLLLDKLNSTSPEMNFGRDVLNKIPNHYLIDINNNHFGENEMGYFHIENVRGKGEL